MTAIHAALNEVASDGKPTRNLSAAWEEVAVWRVKLRRTHLDRGGGHASKSSESVLEWQNKKANDVPAKIMGCGVAARRQ